MRLGKYELFETLSKGAYTAACTAPWIQPCRWSGQRITEALKKR